MPTHLDPAKLANIRIILTHDSCADGTASAILLKDAFHGRDVQVRFLQHGSAELSELTAEPGMLFCDFSPPQDKVQSFIDAGAILLDHHRTAAQIVEAFGENGIFGDERDDGGSCGAVLAYRHVWKPLRGDLLIQELFCRNLATLAGIRDTWQRQDPRWEEACIQANVLNFIPNPRWLARSLTDLAAAWDREYKPIGEILWEKSQRQIHKALDNAYRFTTRRGTRVVMFDGLNASSDAAETLGDTADLVVGFMPSCSDGIPKYIWSTRSHTTFDCATLAQSFGGGGHTRAAGFNAPIKIAEAGNPYAFFEDLLETYEERIQ